MGAPMSQVQQPPINSPQNGGKMAQQSPINSPQNGGKMGPIGMSNQAIQPDKMSSAVVPVFEDQNITFPGQSGQPKMGQPNRYSNTVGSWDNSTIGTQNPFQFQGNRRSKGKGA